MPVADRSVLLERLAARASQSGDEAAFLAASGDVLTYHDWHHRSDAVARGLVARGLGPGARVVLWFDRHHWPDFAVAALGVHKAGAVIVALAGHLPALDVARVVADCGASGVVGSRTVSLPAIGAWTALARELEAEGGAAAGRPRPAPDPLEIAYQCRFLQRPLGRRLSPDDAVSAMDDDSGGPLVHACPVGTHGARRALWSPLAAAGGPVVTLPVFDPDLFCAVSVERRAARWLLDPAAALLLLETGTTAAHDLSTVGHVVLCGGPATPALVSRLGAALPAASVVAADAPSPNFARLSTVTVEKRAKNRAEAAAPLSASQEGMIWHEQFAPGSQNLPPLVRRYRGRLDLDVLEQALTEIVRRHEPLRTTFEMRDGQPVQVVAAPRRLTLSVHDMGELSPPDQDVALDRLLGEAARPFDLVAGPLFEATVARMGADDHVVVLRAHHSVYDDWSVGVFRAELSALYAAFLVGETSPLDEPPVGFADYSRQQHEQLAGPEGAAELAWWKERLAGAPLCLQLPIDDPDRPEGALQASAAPVSLELAPELRLHLVALARRERATVFMAVLAAFSALVWRYTGQADLLMSAVVANRNRTDLEAMIGCFTKKVVVRQNLGGDPSFRELVARTRTAVLGALAHQDPAFEAVVQAGLGRRAAALGLVPYPVVMFQGVTPKGADVVLPGLTSTGYHTSATTVRTHFMGGENQEPAQVPWGAGLYSGTFLILSMEAGDSLSLVARGAFHRPSVELLLENLQAVLAAAVDRPSAPVSQLSTAWADERSGDDTGTGDDIGRCAHQLFADAVARAPAKLAVSDDRRALTFAELDDRATALAGRLRALGVGPEMVVGLHLPPSIDCALAALGVWKAGAAWVGLDEGDSDEHIASVLGHASVEVVIAPPRCDRRELRRRCRLVTVDDVDDLPPLPATEIDPGSPALTFYGSQVDAVSGVVLDHRAVANLAVGLDRAVYRPSFCDAAEVRVALSASPGDDAFLRQLVGLLHGHTLRVIAGGTESLVAAVRGGTVDVVDCDPAAMQALLEAGLPEALATTSRAPAHLLAVVVAGRQPIAIDLCQALEQLPHAHVFRMFGPPECSFAATVEAASSSTTRFTAGRPMAHVVARVLDATGAPLPVRATGELHLGGAGLAWGAADPAGLYPTGRLARCLPDGRIEILGAVADVVDVGGFRVDRRRMEIGLSSGARVATSGSGHASLAASVTARDDDTPTLAELRVGLWRKLPGYVWSDAAVDGAGNPLQAGRVPEEEVLRTLWAEAPGREEMMADGNYWQRFSFLHVVARAREAGIALSGRQVTRNRTITTLAADMAASRLGPTRGTIGP